MLTSASNFIMDLHVLIVDDNVDYTNGLAYFLDNKFKIDIVNDFRIAEEIMTRKKYDFVFLDIRDDARKDRTAGIRLLQRSKHTDPSIRIIMFSSWADNPTRMECIRSGALACIEKKMSFPDMIEEIERLFLK